MMKLQSNLKFNHIFSNQSNNTKYTLWLSVGIALFVFVLIINILTPMIADDFAYSFAFGKGGDHRISSISDVIDSQICHYFTWGGRFVVHFIVQILLMLPPVLADIMNSIVFIVYIALIYYLVKGRERHSITMFILVFFAVWFIQPSIGDTILWMTGSGNYLWGTVLTLFYILPFRFYKGYYKNSISSYINAFLFFLYGIIAGATNENTVGGMIVLTILFLFVYKSQNWTIPKWALTGLLGAIIGFLLMILAPGNMVRAGESMHIDISILIYRFKLYTWVIVKNYGIIVILYILFLYLTNNRSLNLKSMSITQQMSIIFIIAMLASVYAMLLSPEFPTRAWFGAITFMIIGFGMVFYTLSEIMQFRHIFTLLVGIAFLFPTYFGMKDIINCNRMMNDRKPLIQAAIINNESSITVERFKSGTKFTHEEDLISSPAISRYYGIKIEFND